MLANVTFSQVSTVIGALVAVAVGFVDVKTGVNLGQSFDVGLISFGVGLLAGVTLPNLPIARLFERARTP